MDKASAKLSRAETALSLAYKAGTEATRGELLDTIAAALEEVRTAKAVLGEEETRAPAPGMAAPAGEEREKAYIFPTVISAH